MSKVGWGPICIFQSMISSYIGYLLFTHSRMQKLPAQKELLVGEMCIYKLQVFVAKGAIEL